VNVLVIGGNRFVGLLATWRLVARGDRVTLLNRGSLPDPFGDRVERLRGDRTTDLERLVQADIERMNASFVAMETAQAQIKQQLQFLQQRFGTSSS